MPKNLNVFAGPGQITLYDSTNGYLFLGHLGDIEIEEKALTHKNIKHELIRYDRYFTLSAMVYESNRTLISDLESRVGTAQDIYIIGAEGMLKISGVKVHYEVERVYGKDDPHAIEIVSRWGDEDKHNFYVNLLTSVSGLEFKFENFSGNIASGWSAFNYDVVSSVSSFRTGNAQLITWLGAPTNQFMRNSFFPCPFNAPVRLTASVYAQDQSFGNGDFQIGVSVKYTDNTMNTFLTDIPMSEISSGSSGTRVSYSEIIVPSKPIKEIYMRFGAKDYDSLGVEIDDAQLEIGHLSNFRED
jgi:hypothetical protein